MFAGQGIDELQLISFSGTSSYTNDALYSTTINSPAVLPFCTCTLSPYCGSLRVAQVYLGADQ